MKLTKSQLKELIRHSIKSIVSEEDVMDKKIKYKTDDGEEKEATVGGILKKGEDHPAHKQAQAMVDKGEGKPKPTKTKPKKTIKTCGKSVRTQFFGSFKIEMLMVISLKQNHTKVYKKLRFYRDWVPGHNFLAHFKSRFSVCYLFKKIIKKCTKNCLYIVIGCRGTIFWPI